MIHVLLKSDELQNAIISPSVIIKNNSYDQNSFQLNFFFLPIINLFVVKTNIPEHDQAFNLLC